MDSSSARVELDTGSSWLRPKFAGRVGNVRCLWEIAGRGLGSKIRDLDVDGSLGGGGGGEWELLEGVAVSVDTERMTMVRKAIWEGWRRAIVESIVGCRG